MLFNPNEAECDILKYEMPGQNFEEQRFSKDPFNQKNRKNKECEASN